MILVNSNISISFKIIIYFIIYFSFMTNCACVYVQNVSILPAAVEMVRIYSMLIALYMSHIEEGKLVV